MRLHDDADDFIAALTSLLKTILRMSGISEDELHFPNANGNDLHPEQSAILPTKKAPEVIELLRRMPHVTNIYQIQLAPSTPMMDYWENPTDTLWPYQSWHPRPAEDWKEKNPPAIISAMELPIAGSGDPYSHTVILDLSGSQITARIHSSIYLFPCEVHGSGERCPLFCPHQSGVLHMPAVQLLQDWERKFLTAEFMPNPYGGAVSPDEINVHDWRNRMQTVFLTHGWPGQSFDAAKVNEIVTADGFMDDWESPDSSEREDDDDD